MQPDQAVVNATVQTHNDTNAGAAIGANEATYERVVAAVTALGIPRDGITLSYYNVNYVAPPTGNASYAYGFTVERNFAIKVNRVALAGNVVDAAIGAGATNINGVTFGLQNTAAASNQAMMRAVTDATQRAQALAHDAGLHVVGIASIAFGNAYTPVPMLHMTAAALEPPAPAPPTTFDTASATVSVTVTMVFLAKP